MTILQIPDPGDPDLLPEDDAVEIERVMAGIRDVPPEVVACGHRIMLHLYNCGEGDNCHTIADLQRILPNEDRDLIPPTLAFLQVDGYVGKHLPDDGDAMHYYLTQGGAEKLQAN